jgi:hypothetical protein
LTDDDGGESSLVLLRSVGLEEFADRSDIEHDQAHPTRVDDTVCLVV